MLDMNHLARSAFLEVKHDFDRTNLSGPNLRKGTASGPKFCVAAFGYEPELEIRLLHQHPLRVTHGRSLPAEFP
jgi:hypothetical protein